MDDGPFRTPEVPREEPRKRDLWDAFAGIAKASMVTLALFGMTLSLVDPPAPTTVEPESSLLVPFCTQLCETYGLRPVNTFWEICGHDGIGPFLETGRSCTCGNETVSVTAHCDGRIAIRELP